MMREDGGSRFQPIGGHPSAPDLQDACKTTASAGACSAPAPVRADQRWPGPPRHNTANEPAAALLDCDSYSGVPMTVKEADRFLGVSPQTVYVWVERKQIPHLRVMGRNIRFLRSDLEAFRAQFKQEVENGKTA